MAMLFLKASLEHVDLGTSSLFDMGSDGSDTLVGDLALEALDVEFS